MKKRNVSPKSLANLKPGSREQCIKAGKARAIARNVDGMNLDMTFRPGVISTNTSGVQGVSWDKRYEKWHVYIGYKSRRITLGYFDFMQKSLAETIRVEAENAIRENRFEDFCDELGININKYKIQNKVRR